MPRIRWTARLAAALALVAAPLTIAIAPASNAVGGPAENEAMQQLGSCLASGKQGDLLLVLDTSLSLEESDPDFGRIEAATYLVEQLQSYAELSSAKIDVAVAGFAHDFNVSKEWTPLTAPAIDPIVSDLASYRDRFGFETDYWAAVTGARRYLDKKNDDGDHCQAWVWFSDGKFDLDYRSSTEEREKYGVLKEYGPQLELTSAANADKVESAGVKDLCRVGGAADALRSRGILTLAVGLQDGSNSDFSLMQGVATGSERCGRASETPSGQFVFADNIGELFFAFDALSDPDHAPITQTSALCQGSVCPEGSHRFVLDPSISKVHILAGADAADFAMELYGPDQKKVLSLDPGGPKTQDTTRAFDVTTEWLSNDAVQIDIVRKRDAGWVGQWTLAFIDPGSSGDGDDEAAKSNIHLYGDIEPTWLEAGSDLTTGEDASLTFGLVRSGENTPLNAASLTSVVGLDAAIEYADGTRVDIVKGLTKEQLSEPQALSLDGASPGSATVQVTLNLTTAAIQAADSTTIPGTPLEPRSVDFPVTIAAPPNFPTVPGAVSFGQTDEVAPLKAVLPVSGDGCVWLDQAESLTLPEGVSSVEVTSSASSKDTCVSGKLPLTVTPSEVGAGLASGELTLVLASDDGSAEPVNAAVQYDLEMQNPRNEKVFWPVLVGVTLLGILIPLALLYLVKWRTSTIPGNSILIGRAAGPVDAQSSFLTSVSLAMSDLPGTTIAGTDRRSLQLNALSAVRTKMGLSPTEPGYAVVVGQPSASSANPASTRKSKARLPLALQDHWIALLDSANPHTGPVEVVFLVAPTSQKLSELVADARARVPDVVTQLRSRLGEAAGPMPPAAPQQDDWGNPITPGSSTAATPPSSSSTTLDEW